MIFKCAHTEVVPIENVIENPRNPNKHPDKQIKMLAKIIDFQGQRSPIVISNRSGFIVKGHGRLAALRLLGWEKVAIDKQDYANEAEEHADLIADNKIAELAEHLTIELCRHQMVPGSIPGDRRFLELPAESLILQSESN